MYFGLNENSNTKSCIQPTAYAIAQGVFVDGASASWWWLRSPGHEQYDAACVGADGSLYYHDVRDSSGAVRPAIWVDLDSPFFNSIVFQHFAALPLTPGRPPRFCRIRAQKVAKPPVTSCKAHTYAV